MQTNEALDMEVTANVLKLLGDKTHLTMVRIMSAHECCVCEFVDLFDMSQPAISQHLRKLKDSGIVNEERRGQWIFYSLNQKSSYYSFIQTVIKDLPSQAFKVEELIAQGKRICCD
ncbi:metalloregulator ArsR/SmtB family transcription factor [Peribacillus frigoritolerans]|uniref:ArsR/SmtB family transcription factor n=1 Tax=Peribacillus frigoritolerans TaxID=450367 RepID=UPI0021A9B1E5|nr:metalloregulator ArsR/SmtB family transcription factor [Peribacillus frigoritolerans]MCT4477710.1 metalloregulator ArsR/SmtB family transcription factor [Peribacillus frigoritolerans]